MNFRITAVIFFISSFFVPAGFAQTAKPSPPPPKLAEKPLGQPCRLKLSELSTLRGLRLEMPKDEVQKQYPLMVISPDPVKSSGIALSHQISDPEYGEDLDRITIVFRNNKVFSILLTYTNLISWDSIEEFADKVSKSLNLPKATSRKLAGGEYYSVNCEEFGVRTRINSEKQGTLLLTKDPEELWESTRQKKDSFKP